MKKVHPYSEYLQMEPQYTIPQPDGTDEATLPSSESEVEVTKPVDIENIFQSTPDDQLFLIQVPGNEGALSQQSDAQAVSDQELSTATVPPRIEDDQDNQGSNQNVFQLPAIWFND